MDLLKSTPFYESRIQRSKMMDTYKIISKNLYQSATKILFYCAWPHVNMQGDTIRHQFRIPIATIAAHSDQSLRPKPSQEHRVTLVYANEITTECRRHALWANTNVQNDKKYRTKPTPLHERRRRL